MGHTHRYQFCFKKKNQVKSPSPESRVPETGSYPPIGSDRDSGCGNLAPSTFAKVGIKTSVPAKLWCDNQVAFHIGSNRVFRE